MINFNFFRDELNKFNKKQNEIAKMILNEYGYPNDVVLHTKHSNHHVSFVIDDKILATISMSIGHGLGGSIQFNHSCFICTELKNKYPDFRMGEYNV